MPRSRDTMGVRTALFFSDVHLGWVPCTAAHERWLAALPAAAADAELIVLNGDIVDLYRGLFGARERAAAELLGELVTRWRNEGRRVECVEGNHDQGTVPIAALQPTSWHLEFEGHGGERIRVLHGHRFSDRVFTPGVYEGVGLRLLAIENGILGHVGAARAIYPHAHGWIAGAWGYVEDKVWRPRFPGRLAPLMNDMDVLVHGHFHYGPGQDRIGTVATHRSGAWVSPGHRGTVDRMLRYRDGRFERIGLENGRWRAMNDGR